MGLVARGNQNDLKNEAGLCWRALGHVSLLRSGRF
jgi:hypothetical protein